MDNKYIEIIDKTLLYLKEEHDDLSGIIDDTVLEFKKPALTQKSKLEEKIKSKIVELNETNNDIVKSKDRIKTNKANIAKIREDRRKQVNITKNNNLSASYLTKYVNMTNNHIERLTAEVHDLEDHLKDLNVKMVKVRDELKELREEYKKYEKNKYITESKRGD